jgi:NADPH:quinone reductase-like Zn-dependent oxidoreductase
MTRTQAWVLPTKGLPNRQQYAGLELSDIDFGRLEDDELLVEPLYGAWEGNMSHALERDPIDIGRAREEPLIVLGNSGVVRVLKTGRSVRGFSENDIGVLISISKWDASGYPEKVFAYDAPGTIGMLAKRTKLKSSQLFKVYGAGDKVNERQIQRWAAYSIRYATAWDNWRVSSSIWRVQMPDAEPGDHTVVAWGGGVAFGELQLARQDGFRVAMCGSSQPRLKMFEREQFIPIDRSRFADMQFDARRFKQDFQYRKRYLAAEALYLETIDEITLGRGVAIFIDNIGGPVYRATLKALGRQGVVTTVGWKRGMALCHNRGEECIARHTHVHTHGAKRSVDSFRYSLENDWLPPAPESVYEWEEIGQLAEDYMNGRIVSYFPVYKVNDY